jgi:hypothetical protein
VSSRRELLRAGAGLAAALALGAPAGLAGAQAVAPEAAEPSWARPGPYRSPGWTDFAIGSFRSDEPVVAAYFFYWFDADFLNAQRRTFDPYPFHAVDQATHSFRDPRWYLKQFNDMVDAGIDVVLPDYWGEPGQHNRRVAPAPELNLFATEGIPPMIEGLRLLEEQGRSLKIGLFLDTTIMNDADLTIPAGKRIFYASIRDYYSRIPPRYWAAIDGRPLVWLYDAQRVAAFDQSSFDYIYAQFPGDFGGLSPWIVREYQWYQAKNTTTDQVIQTEGFYGWGAAPSGFNEDTRFTVAQVGPGFKNTQFGGPGRIDTPRQNGAYYEYQLQRALASGRKIWAIETWNELGEGSGILETVEFGRQYIELTRRYVDRLKGRA